MRMGDIDYLYFACDWVDDAQAVKYVADLIHIARKLNIELILGSIPSGRTTGEGYFFTRFLIRVPSLATYQEFLQQLPQGTALSNWILVSSDDYQTQRNRRKSTLPEMFEAGDFTLEGFSRNGAWNCVLREKLNGSNVLYYSHDWLVPLQSDNFIKIPDKTWDWHERYLSSPLIRLCKLAEYLGRGHSVRGGEKSKDAQGLAFQQLIIRFFSSDEFEEYSEKSGIESNGWYSVAEEEYKAAHRILEHTLTGLRDFYLEVERMGHENSLILGNRE